MAGRGGRTTWWSLSGPLATARGRPEVDFKEIKALYWDRLEELEDSFNQCSAKPPDILEMTELYNRHFNSHLEPVYSGPPFDLGGILSGRVILHPYQNSEIRRLLDAGRGLCAFEVGLGKTYIALGLAALGLMTGRFRRLAFIVPASVVGHWQREAELLFTARYVRDNFFYGRRLRQLL